MAISVGEKIPSSNLLKLGEDGPEHVSLDEITAGRKVVVFAVPGAYTPTCTQAHVPSFIRAKDALEAKGVQEIVCVAVNDPFVVHAWSEATNAEASGITMLSDSDGSFTKSIGMDFSAPPAGLFNRSARYSMLVEDQVVVILNKEESPGICETSAGETLLSQM
ncbi:MAG: peroxiredoxin [Albidovulum sp.]|nr:peroxiredoxin [Albidovulum sp.]MDE0532268.1 peroxiredoxin [Albidovulum sp.]